MADLLSLIPILGGLFKKKDKQPEVNPDSTTTGIDNTKQNSTSNQTTTGKETGTSKQTGVTSSIDKTLGKSNQTSTNQGTSTTGSKATTTNTGTAKATDSAKVATQQQTTSLDAGVLAGANARLKEMLGGAGLGASQDAMLTEMANIKAGIGRVMDPQAYAAGITNAADNRLTNDMNGKINEMLSTAGSGMSGNSMAMLLGQQMNQGKEAQLAGISNEALMAGSDMAAKQAASLTDRLTSVSSGLNSSITNLLASINGAQQTTTGTESKIGTQTSTSTDKGTQVQNQTTKDSSLSKESGSTSSVNSSKQNQSQTGSTSNTSSSNVNATQAVDTNQVSGQVVDNRSQGSNVPPELQKILDSLKTNAKGSPKPHTTGPVSSDQTALMDALTTLFSK